MTFASGSGKRLESQLRRRNMCARSSKRIENCYRCSDIDDPTAAPMSQMPSDFRAMLFRTYFSGAATCIAVIS
jgi:hypothetical protein